MSLFDAIRNSLMNPAEKAKKQLLDRKIEYNAESFIRMVQEGKLEEVQLFLDSGMDPATKSSKGLAAVVYAARSSRIGVLHALTKGGADPNTREPGGNPLLLEAIIGHRVDAAKALIAAGANVDARDNSGLSALMLAVKENQQPIAEAMIHAGADALVQNHTTLESALVMAAQRGQVGMTELLLRNVITSEDRDAKDRQGATALWWAANNGHTAVAQILLSKKANPNLANDAGVTPLAAANAGGHAEIVRMLQEAGAKS